MKVKRKMINDIYADAIDDMYDKESASGAGAKAPVRT